MRVRTPIAVLLAAAALAACGEDEEKDTAKTGTSGPTTAATEETNVIPKPPAAKDLAKKPRIPKPKGSPPRELVIEDIVKGRGRAAKEGDSVTVNYVGVAHSTGRQFDASWDRGEPFTIQQLGAGEVIPGWDEGLVGMRQGGRRELVIPADKAYGPQGQPPDIGPNETLVFVIDLLRIR